LDRFARKKSVVQLNRLSALAGIETASGHVCVSAAGLSHDNVDEEEEAQSSIFFVRQKMKNSIP
jgi:hypothetical protein